MIYCIIITLLVLAGLFNGVKDKLYFHYDRSLAYRYNWNEKWWNPSLSWENKYKNKFLKVVVQLSDAWHFFKELSITCFCLSLAMLIDFDTIFIVKFFAIRFLFWFGFLISYR